MRQSIIIILVIVGAMAAANLSSPVTSHVASKKTIAYFKSHVPAFYRSTEDLYLSIQSLSNTDSTSLDKTKKALINCRLQYKQISFLLDYFFPNLAIAYNAPAKFEAEDPFAEFENPHGLQQIESLLFGSDPSSEKMNMLDEATVIRESAKDLDALCFQWLPSDSSILKSIRMEIIRIMTLYIEGYDAQFLKSGLAESVNSLRSLKEVFGYCINTDNIERKNIEHRFEAACDYLKKHQGFDLFDRLTFLSNYVLPLENGLNVFINMKFPGCHFQNIFSGGITGFVGKGNKEMVELGRKLFFDKVLSGNSSRSCASCHVPRKYYTDGLPQNFSIDKDSQLKRNTPTLLYAAYQTCQFWDGRAKNLEDQVKTVLTSKTEMNGSAETIEMKLNADKTYKKSFAKAFNRDVSENIKLDKICQAISAFLQKLSPMQSPFDQYLHGNKKAMTAIQKRGFNLFAGKAQCATCHFFPLFNGLIPPEYNRSEFEIIGAPLHDNFKKPVADNDIGHYVVSPLWFNRAAFKTPTLRNISMTGPYMHNGNFTSLAKVIEFYNLGGGTGIGLDVPGQTLSIKPLGLTKSEQKAIISFLSALTDPEETVLPVKKNKQYKIIRSLVHK